VFYKKFGHKNLLLDQLDLKAPISFIAIDGGKLKRKVETVNIYWCLAGM